jgi:tetratricopeptide (TPR) repeat protein
VKTALAVHWAHRVAAQFPDGQLYVNLRGFDPRGQALPAAHALRGFLDALGVPPQRLPADLCAQSGLYRSLLAGTRMLVVLDNARDAEQARPLLPGAPGCLAVVTSRNRLAGLIAADGAHPLTLDLLTAAESRQLLAHRIGRDRIAAEPHATDHIISRCTGLPLALAVAAAHAATHPDFPLAQLADDLRETRDSLEAFDNADPATNMRAVFSCSYRTLSPTTARLFRLLGLHPGPDISAPAAASLAGIPAADIRPPLAELTRAHLLNQHSPGRYTFHDLLRTYAAELAHNLDGEDQRRAAIHRTLDHYLHTAHTAALAYTPHRDPIALTPPQPAVTPQNITGRGRAVAWLTTEHHVLLAAIAHAATSGFDTHTWQLASSLTDYLYRRGHWQDLLTTHNTALHAAQQASDPLGQAHAHRGLAGAHTQQRRYEDARTHVRHALRLCHQLDDHARAADTLLDLGYTYEQEGRYRDALRHARQALDILNTIGHTAGQAKALNNVGWYHTQLGDHQQALTHCQRALDLSQQAGDRWVEAATWDSLGWAHHHLGHHRQATDCYQRSLDLRRLLGDRYWEADTLTHLGQAHLAAGEPDAARTSWHQAIDILTELHHPNADHLRTKLHTIETDPDRQAGPMKRVRRAGT